MKGTTLNLCFQPGFACISNVAMLEVREKFGKWHLEEEQICTLTLLIKSSTKKTESVLMTHLNKRSFTRENIYVAKFFTEILP